jgi:hypothetical protein
LILSGSDPEEEVANAVKIAWLALLVNEPNGEDHRAERLDF